SLLHGHGALSGRDLPRQARAVGYAGGLAGGSEAAHGQELRGRKAARASPLPQGLHLLRAVRLTADRLHASEAWRF
ncbi:MAG: hypothetical protein ACREHG_00660, partial [Candidatus Saccharimonadales bacterium]